MHPYRPPGGTQLALVFRGAGTLWALPASAVREVVSPFKNSTLHQHLVVEDFSALFHQCGARDGRAVTLVLDCTPPRAICVDGIEEVVDLATAPFFGLPQSIEVIANGIIRGVVLYGKQLVLELMPRQLAQYSPSLLGSTAIDRPVFPPVNEQSTKLPGRALVFEAGAGVWLGAPLPLVSGVLQLSTWCPVPVAPMGHRGFIHHERSIISLFDISLMRGKSLTSAELAVVLEVGGAPIGVLANRILGVLEGFGGEPQIEPGGTTWRARDARRVFFPDYPHWFGQGQ